MNVDEFRVHGKEMIDYICEYTRGVDAHKVTPIVQPGFLRDALPAHPPYEPESWKDVMRDVHALLLPGVTHWQHSGFHAYFPYGASFPSLLGELMGDALGSNSFSWTASPTNTELEIVVMDWLVHALGLPKHFHSSTSGGGALTPSASEAILNCMLAARERGLSKLRTSSDSDHDCQLLHKLIVYCSEEAHSALEKAAKICMLTLRVLPTDDDCVLHGDVVQKAFENDVANGFLPIFLSATVGTTSTATFDDLATIGPVCSEYDVWFHVDAAYAGSSFICPEMSQYKNGIEYADSFNCNPYKWLLTGADCACLWVKDKLSYCSGFIVDPIYLQAGNTDLSMDLRHWGISLTRKFRALKIWFVIRNYGIKGIQQYQRNHMALAKYLEELLLEDARFEVVNKVRTGLVCFRVKTSNEFNCMLLKSINDNRVIHLTPTSVKNKYILRFCVNSEHATKEHVLRAWQEISSWTTRLLNQPGGDMEVLSNSISTKVVCPLSDNDAVVAA